MTTPISEMKRGDEHQTDVGSQSLESENEAKRRGTKMSATSTSGCQMCVWACFCRLLVRSRPELGPAPAWHHLPGATAAVVTDFCSAHGPREGGGVKVEGRTGSEAKEVGADDVDVDPR